MSENLFVSELKKLNVAQRQAVEAIEGPVMVVAGPGTGKTQVVALRIANILQKTQLSPKNILALTFTEAGVTALRGRLSTYIGPLAYQVTIATFHGFANEVIGTFPHVFSIAQNIAQIDDLERLLLIEKLIKSDSSLKLLRPLRSETAHVRDIATAIRTAKQEAISSKQLVEHGKKLLKQEPKSKVELERTKRIGGILLEFAKVLDEYQTELRKRSVYDYEDMILFVLDALRNNAEIKAYFQERYQYILVDEYQDTNNAQNTLVELLADFFETPNLFVVGDDKQAIYRFQGASVANMLHFHRRYPHLQIISLTENFRSTPEILESAAALISNNQLQLSKELPLITNELVASQKSKLKPELIIATTQISERYELINRLSQLHNQGIAWDQMAVLFRTNSEANDFRDVAEKSGLAVAGLQSTDLLKEREIQVLLHMLRAVCQPTDDIAMAGFLRASLTNEDALAAIELIRLAREKKIKLISAAIDSENPSINSLAKKILSWHGSYEKMTLPEIIEEVLYRGGLLEMARKRPQQLSGLELIASLIGNSREYAKRNQKATLADWLEYLELHYTYGLPFSVNRSRAESSGIFINTVHQAKGLEFEVVAIPRATDRVWRVKPNRNVVKIPGDLTGLKKWDHDELEDMRRLFYVALTRAKKYLIVSYSKLGADGKEELPSQLVEEIKSTIVATTPTPSEQTLSDFVQLQLSPTSDETLSNSELEFIRERVKRSPFSFTAYWDYKICPRTYLLKHIYCLPTPFVPSLMYGEAVHAALERFSRDYKTFKKLPSKQKLLEYFREEIVKGIPYGDRELFLNQGLDVLSSFFEHYSPTWQRPADVEYSFRPHQVMLGDIWLNGKIDCIEPTDATGRSVRVIDYKTGSQSRTRNYIEGKTQDSDGKMKAQLVFYAMLCQVDPLFPYQPKEFVLQFIDDKKSFRSESFIITQDEINKMKNEVTNAYSEILSRESFPIGDENSDLVLQFGGST